MQDHPLKPSAPEVAAAERLLRLALDEDLGERGDVTSEALMPPDRRGRAAYVAREAGVMAGMACLPLLADMVDRRVDVAVRVRDGQAFAAGDELAVISGPMRAILAIERTSLNVLQRLCGVATLTRRFVEAVAGHRTQLLDTRKTTPGFRHLEKYAVRCGGGHNHRLGLHDQVLIKDNHLAGLDATDPAAAVVEAVDRARRGAPAGMLIELEVDSLEQLRAALTTPVDIVLLDNMPPSILAEAVALRNRGPRAPAPLLEASGGITLKSVADVAASGVDRISIGALTHSAGAVDIALDFVPSGAED